ncbi:hypothetical protein [Ottowia testudinis]|uniref:DUF2484 family protein n=1 Tax=Ottowia testudinis TaxID=2816950 RepID=A0A975CIF5_9BURK|nr:hypothetical protein [Ottowia testudinis]QTD46164.1 hypothetical protein J1M35_04465 [Ottowia testudinis]
MHPFLLATFAALIAILLTLVEPMPRNVLALKTGALAALLMAAGAVLWPHAAATILIGIGTYWLVRISWGALLWPLRFVATILRSH